jgi:hypothetical protein
MKRVSGGALANKRAADARAHALASTIRKLMAAGPVSRRALANKLNQKRTPTVRGGSWHYTTVVRMLTRLGLITKGTINNGSANKKAADARAKALASTIRKLRKAGFVGIKAIARELNERRIPTARGGKWHRNSTWRLLHRLERLEHSSARRRPMSEAEQRARSSSRHRR